MHKLAFISTLTAIILLAVGCAAPDSGRSPAPILSNPTAQARIEDSYADSVETIAAVTANAAYAIATDQSAARTAQANIDALSTATRMAQAATDGANAAATATADMLTSQAQAQETATEKARAAALTQQADSINATATIDSARATALVQNAKAQTVLLEEARKQDEINRLREQERQREQFNTWAPPVALSALFVLALVFGLVRIHVMQIQGSTVNGRDGSTFLVMGNFLSTLFGGKFVVSSPSRALGAYHVVDPAKPQHELADEKERTHMRDLLAKIALSDNATRAYRGLLETIARASGESVARGVKDGIKLLPPPADVYALPAPARDPERLESIVMLEPHDAQTAPDLIAPRLLAAVNRDWDSSDDNE